MQPKALPTPSACNRSRVMPSGLLVHRKRRLPHANRARSPPNRGRGGTARLAFRRKLEQSCCRRASARPSSLQAPANHRAHGVERMRRKSELDKRLIKRGRKILDGIHQRPVEVDAHRAWPCARLIMHHTAVRARSALRRMAAMLSR
jgi:hypothetical protein